MEVRQTMVVTRSGRIIDLAAPKVEDICIADVAWQLAHEIRWNGCLGLLSVAQHCVAVEEALQECSPRVRLFGLLHDAAEAYTGDVVTPWKRVVNTYPGGQPWSDNEKILQRTCEAALIADRTLDAHERFLVEEADGYAAREEARRFGTVAWIDALERVAPGYARNMPKGVPRFFTYDGQLWTPEQATERFLRRYSELKKIL